MTEIPPSDEIKTHQFIERFRDWLDACYDLDLLDSDEDGRLHPNELGLNIAMVILCGLHMRDPERFEQMVDVARLTEEDDE